MAQEVYGWQRVEVDRSRTAAEFLRRQEEMLATRSKFHQLYNRRY